jgi:hypothetical protein
MQLIDEPLPDLVEARIEPGRVFDRAVDLDGVPTWTDEMVVLLPCESI